MFNTLFIFLLDDESPLARTLEAFFPFFTIRVERLACGGQTPVA